MRPVKLVIPDTSQLIDVLLLSEGFVHAKVLSNKTCQLWSMMTNQVCLCVCVHTCMRVYLCMKRSVCILCNKV